MVNKLVGQPITKTYTNVDVLQRANKIFAILERDAKNGNNYAIGVISELFRDSKSSRNE